MSNATLFSPTLSGLRIAVLTLALAAGGAWAQGSQPAAAEPGAPVLPKPIDPSTIPASEAPPPFNPALAVALLALAGIHRRLPVTSLRVIAGIVAVVLCARLAFNS